MAKYESAIRTDDNTFIHIEEVKESSYGRNAHFVCPCCKLEMRPVMGPKREDHFRHKGEPCKYDKYLHTIAEETFLREYIYCLDAGEPFVLDITARVRCNGGCVLFWDQDCKDRFISREMDLTQRFKIIRKETRVETGPRSYRRPDILLESESGEQLWVEFFVTHQSEESKIRDAAQRDAKIIEIKIYDEQCDGLKAITSHHFTQIEDIVLHNFETEDVDPPKSFCPPCMKHLVFKNESEDDKFLGIAAGYKHSDITSEVPTGLEEGFDYIVALRLNYMSDFTVPMDGRSARFPKETYLHLKEACSRRYQGFSFPMHLRDLVACEFRRPREVVKHEEPITVVRPQEPAALSEKDDEIKSTPELSSGCIPTGVWMSLNLPSGILWCDRDGDDTPKLPDGYEKCLPSLDDIEELKQCPQWRYKDGICYYDGEGNRLLFHWDTNYLLENGGTWTPSKEEGDFYAARETNVSRYIAKRSELYSKPVYRTASGTATRSLSDEEVNSLFPKKDFFSPPNASSSCFFKEDPDA